MNPPADNDGARMADPTRPLPNLIPMPDGSWTGHTVLTPTALKTRGLFTLPPSKVVPVIVVPGIMGTNLRAATSPRKKANKVLSPNDEAWRPPNGFSEDLNVWRTWRKRNPAMRQQVLDGATLEVDNRGEISLPKEARDFGIGEEEARERRWGEVHWDSYGRLLCTLYIGLNHTFDLDPLEKRVLRGHWKTVMECEPARWGVRTIDKITEKELEKHAEYYYPVYAFGYNWLQSSGDSANQLRAKIEKIIKYWHGHNRTCTKVILVTHSMGGLVARACAKQIPELILGVIHGVMPAAGAPACYRRIASGTETSSPSNDIHTNKEAAFIADILGNKPELTMPSMATAPGPLELLPSHLYPQPWLHLRIVSRTNNKDVTRDVVHLPTGNPYDLYRDMKSWYRLIDPQLVDPAKMYEGNMGAVESAVNQAIDRAERFHRETLDTYYHPNTFAFYGADRAHMSFGTVRWVARDPGDGSVFTEANLQKATTLSYGAAGSRQVHVEGKTTLQFSPAPQDSAGDGTVPQQSGASPLAYIRQLFELRGLDHQNAYKDEAALLLTQHLVVKMVQELP
jgi:pimeloyl-ACP methyl ester carboxylesterase